MALTTMIDGSGRIVIPKEIREEMKLGYGTFLVVEKEGENTIRLKIVRTADTGDSSASRPNSNAISDQNSEREKMKRFLEG